MVKLLFLFIFSTSFTWATPACFKFYNESHAYNVTLNELVSLHSEIQQMDINNPDKSYLLSQLKLRLQNLTISFGLPFKNAFLQKVSLLDPDHKEELARKERLAKEAQKEAEEILRGFRKVLHQDLKSIGPFYTEHEFFSVRDGDLILYNYKTKTESWRIELNKLVPEVKSDLKLWGGTTLLLTPDKKTLVIGNAGHIISLDIKTQKAVHHYLGTDMGGIRMSSDGKNIFYTNYEPPITVVFDTETLTRNVHALAENQRTLNLKRLSESLDGRYVLPFREGNGTRLIDLKTMEVSRLPELDVESKKWDAVFIPNSNRILVSTFENKFFEYDIATHKLNPSTFPGTHATLDVSSNGQHIITHGTITGTKEYRVSAFNSKTFATEPVQFPSDLVTDGYTVEYQATRIINDSKQMQFLFTKPDFGTFLVFLDLNTLTFTKHLFDYASMEYVMMLSPDGESLFGVKERFSGIGDRDYIELH